MYYIHILLNPMCLICPSAFLLPFGNHWFVFCICESVFHTHSFVLFFLLLLFSHTVVSNSLRPQGLQHARLPFPSPSPGVFSNSCPLTQWCHPTISSSVSPFSCPPSFPAWVFSNESVLRIRWPKYWSFSFSPSNEYSGLISFRIDWFDLLAVQGTLKSLF